MPCLRLTLLRVDLVVRRPYQVPARERAIVIGRWGWAARAVGAAVQPEHAIHHLRGQRVDCLRRRHADRQVGRVGVAAIDDEIGRRGAPERAQAGGGGLERDDVAAEVVVRVPLDDRRRAPRQRDGALAAGQGARGAVRGDAATRRRGERDDDRRRERTSFGGTLARGGADSGLPQLAGEGGAGPEGRATGQAGDVLGRRGCRRLDRDRRRDRRGRVLAERGALLEAATERLVQRAGTLAGQLRDGAGNPRAETFAQDVAAGHGRQLRVLTVDLGADAAATAEGGHDAGQAGLLAAVLELDIPTILHGPRAIDRVQLATGDP